MVLKQLCLFFYLFSTARCRHPSLWFLIIVEKRNRGIIKETLKSFYTAAVDFPFTATGRGLILDNAF